MAFDDLDAMMNGKLLGVFGEEFQIMPRSRVDDVNSRWTSDANRRPAVFSAIWHENYSRAQMIGERGVASSQSASYLRQQGGHTTARPRIVFPLSAISYRPQQGDWIVRRKTGQKLMVAEVRTLADDNVTLDLNQLDGPA